MTFAQVEPNENFDLCRFRSGPLGLWEAGIINMLWGKGRVRMALAKSGGWVPIDYWGGEPDSCLILLGILMGTCLHLPEQISERELVALLPEQNDKELGPDFWDRLFKAGDQIRETYRDRGAN